MSPRDLQYDRLPPAAEWPEGVLGVTSIEQPDLSAVLSLVVIVLVVSATSLSLSPPVEII